jgi:hypothetical protein
MTPSLTEQLAPNDIKLGLYISTFKSKTVKLPHESNLDFQ